MGMFFKLHFMGLPVALHALYEVARSFKCTILYVTRGPIRSWLHKVAHNIQETRLCLTSWKLRFDYMA